MLLGRLDISGSDYLTSWVSHAFKVNSADFGASSSELVPCLDRWLASELMKGLKGVPGLQFKVQGYIERCTRDGTAVVQCFRWPLVTLTWIGVRGSLITSQSIFQVDLHGHPTSDLQNFSAQAMRVLNRIPHGSLAESTNAW